MRRLFLFVTGAVVVVWGVGAALGGCSTPTNDLLAGPQETRDAAPRDDASTSSEPREGGSVPYPLGNDDTDGGVGAGRTPGMIACGTATCDATQVCCRSSGCIAIDAKCPLLNPRQECDDAADCKNGELCCQDITGATKCQATCNPASTRQLCKTTEECGDAGCSEKTCQSVKEQVCGTGGILCQ